MLENELALRAQKVGWILEQAEKRLAKAPKGTLHASRSHGRCQYRWRISGEGQDRYLKKGDEELVRLLAQKRYDEEVVQVASECQAKTARVIRQLEGIGVTGAGSLEAAEAAAAEGDASLGVIGAGHGGGHVPVVKTADGYRPLRGVGVRVREVEDVYERLPETIRDLVIPYEVGDKHFLATWRKEFHRSESFLDDKCRFLTEQGERVRSKSEVIIADKLYHANIPYRYEPSVTFLDGEVVRPDFLALNPRTRQEVLWEHFGMMDDDMYRRRAWMKLAHYSANGLVPGLGFIATFESKDAPLVTEMVDEVIEYFLR